MEEFVKGLKKLGFKVDATIADPKEWDLNQMNKFGEFQFEFVKGRLNASQKEILKKQITRLSNSLSYRLMKHVDWGFRAKTEILGQNPYKLKLILMKITGQQQDFP
ncbi:hypothetical protein HY989_00755 [Candidatus Micrarchaeota archaeon]|nr:hypothetical protein [Candidatus Micrarchaeota archaeon]